MCLAFLTSYPSVFVQPGTGRRPVDCTVYNEQSYDALDHSVIEVAPPLRTLVFVQAHTEPIATLVPSRFFVKIKTKVVIRSYL